MFDTMIIGRDLSSLIAGLTSSRMGLKTVLITEGDQETEHCDAGYAFPIDPTPLSGFRDDQTIHYLLRKLKLQPDGAPEPLLLNPAMQITLSTHRIDLFHERDRFIRDLVREFPRNERQIKRFYNAVDKARAFVEDRIYEGLACRWHGRKKLLRGLFQLPSIVWMWLSLLIGGTGSARTFRTAVEAQLAVLSHVYTNAASYPLAAAYLLSLPQKGLYSPIGGRAAWMQWLQGRFVEAGGVLMDRCSIMRLDTAPEINIDIERAGTSSTLRGKQLIVSTQWEKLKPLLLQRKVFKRLANRLNTLRPAAYPFSLHLGVREEGLPQQLAPYAVWLQDITNSLIDRGLVYIQISLPGDGELAPEGRRALCATVFIRKSPTMLTDLELSDVAKAIIDSLEGLLPFLRENIDYVNIEKSISLARRSQEMVNQKYRARNWITTGINTLLPVTPLPNVFLTGGLLRAGLGFEGEILAGMDAAFLAGKGRITDGL